MLPSDANGCEFEKSFLLNEQKKKTKSQKQRGITEKHEREDATKDNESLRWFTQKVMREVATGEKQLNETTPLWDYSHRKKDWTL